MRSRVCFIPDSFNLDDGSDRLIQALHESGSLVEKMHSDFTLFSRSSDYSDLAIKVFDSYPEDAGAIMQLLFDLKMSRTSLLDLDSNQILSIANQVPPEQDKFYFSVYKDEPNNALTINPNQTIHNESVLVSYSRAIIIDSDLEHTEYAQKFEHIYKNITFIDDFNQIRKMDGGYKNFIDGITECLELMNFYELDDGNVQGDISNLDSSLPFKLCEEGRGKNKRKIGSLKRIVNYKGEPINVNCEFHYKLEKIDNANGNGTYYFNRIYFGFIKRNATDKKFAIAHIGDHL